jgi:hypothetical protein
MTSFGYFKQKQKAFKNLHDNILDFKVHFESKLILIQWLDENGWMNLMYIEYIIYQFFTTIGPHVCGSWNITKQKKTKKIMQCPYVKFPPLWYGSDLKRRRRYYYTFIAQKYKKTTFFEWNFIQNI